MVYYEHTTTPVIFGFFFVLYYLAIPSALVLWYARSYNYIRKRNFMLKRLSTYLLVAFFITSLSAYKLTSIYLYLHSPSPGALCLTSSCVVSSDPVVRYNLSINDLERAGVPSIGPMTVYRIYDTASSKELGLPTRMNYLVVVRALLVVPAVEVISYNVSGTRVVGKKSFYVVWPFSPGKVLEDNFGVRFTVLVFSGRGGVGA
ncbi:hypothetical protein [Thermococcus sp.]|uniref:hypothetical protein n=1 Tax=Thermococcus sp. TaxID=35749 RepID=UPI0026388CD1|nr:hypothetical protein [Thermococcus sp.]